MDGTLLDNNKVISQVNISAIQQLKRKDVLFVIATGRHDSMIKSYLDELDMDMPVISCNGAMIRDPRTGKIYSSVPLETEQILKIIRICKEYGADYHIYGRDIIYGETLTGKIFYYNQRNQSLSPSNHINLHVSGEYEKFVREQEGHLYKVLVLPAREKDFAPVGEAIFRHTGLQSFQSDNTLLDVMQKGISKASAIETLCRELGIKQQETAAIGDHLNDLDMIEYVGTGVAMQNAVDSVKEAAQLVTDNCNNSSGVAEALKKLIL